MTKILYCAAALLLTAATPASALDRANFELRNVADLVALCDPPQADENRWYGVVYCRGYLRGLGDFNRAFFRQGSLGSCLPNPRPSVAQVSTDFTAWARANPREMSNPDIVDSVVRWAATAYPCPPRR
jgi:hypothetical protein